MKIFRGYRCPAWVSDADLAAASAHFAAAYPREAVGIINDTGYVPLDNISVDPTTSFEAHEDSWVTHAPIKAVLHSHVNRMAKPSEADMRAQISTAVPWAILLTDGASCGEPIWFGDQLEISPLFERPFMHGVHDCYSLVRDTFRMGKDRLATAEPGQRILGWPYGPVTLIDGARDDGWWANDHDDFYTESFARAGFVDLEIADRKRLPGLRIGDCFLYRLGLTQKVNHAGIYIGNNLILHHVDGYTSHRALLNLYAHGAERWLRYMGPEDCVIDDVK
jgi:proteasome lid subunit RPN8/RPN11